MAAETELAGKVALVTAGARNIGRAIGCAPARERRISPDE